MYGLFLDLRKAFGAMDWELCLQILEDRGVGPRIRLFIERFWALALLVCKAGGYYGTAFKALRGVTQGGPLSPRIFNLMIDAVIREWLRQVLGNRVAVDGIRTHIRLLLAAFYADNGLVQSRDLEFLQFSFDILVGFFERVELLTKTKKTEAMTCIPGRIRTALSHKAYANRMEGHEDRRSWQTRRTNCDICGVELSTGSLRRHQESQHGEAGVVAVL